MRSLSRDSVARCNLPQRLQLEFQRVLRHRSLSHFNTLPAAEIAPRQEIHFAEARPKVRWLSSDDKVQYEFYSLGKHEIAPQDLIKEEMLRLAVSTLQSINASSTTPNHK
ncbi:hypothetical protein GHT07_18795 [Caenimonas koreensis DSM 17982]|uniref:Uncharacterized protein n=1 Tax=Caenimonas koreensis DSM 17982 TaxID=1121255 RepID=A0A844B3H9_9BURK|nr:hypothetical protein [Caenimonas koreensis]MRD49328.1 hypothetical protein [Caenimonas koreensis DSM 17982]